MSDATEQKKKRRKKPGKKERAGEGREAADKKPEGETDNMKQKRNSFVLFVGNLPYTSDATKLQKLFCSTQDSPVQVRMLTDRVTGKSKGAAFVEFANGFAVKKALLMHGFDMDGRKIRLELSAGGGGSSEARKDKIKEKQKTLLKERRSAFAERKATPAEELAAQMAAQKERKWERKKAEWAKEKAMKPTPVVATLADPKALEFAEQNGFTKDGRSYLARLSPDVLEVVVNQFKLREGARDPTGILVKFGEAIKRRMEPKDTGASVGADASVESAASVASTGANSAPVAASSGKKKKGKKRKAGPAVAVEPAAPVVSPGNLAGFSPRRKPAASPLHGPADAALKEALSTLATSAEKKKGKKRKLSTSSLPPAEGGDVQMPRKKKKKNKA